MAWPPPFLRCPAVTAARTAAPISTPGDARGLGFVVDRQQLRAQGCIADAAACVDARAQHKAQMIGRGGNRQRSGIAERLETDVTALPHGLQAFGDVGAVQTFERNDVAHGCQPNEIEQSQQIWRRCRSGVVTALAEFASGCNQHHEDDPRRAEMAEPGDVVLPVGIDQRRNIGKAFVGLVVIDHDHVGAQGRGNG